MPLISGTANSILADPLSRALHGLCASRAKDLAKIEDWFIAKHAGNRVGSKPEISPASRFPVVYLWGLLTKITDAFRRRVFFATDKTKEAWRSTLSKRGRRTDCKDQQEAKSWWEGIYLCEETKDRCSTAANWEEEEAWGWADHGRQEAKGWEIKGDIGSKVT